MSSGVELSVVVISAVAGGMEARGPGAAGWTGACTACTGGWLHCSAAPSDAAGIAAVYTCMVHMSVRASVCASVRVYVHVSVCVSVCARSRGSSAGPGERHSSGTRSAGSGSLDAASDSAGGSAAAVSAKRRRRTDFTGSTAVSKTAPEAASEAAPEAASEAASEAAAVPLSAPTPALPALRLATLLLVLLLALLRALLRVRFLLLGSAARACGLSASCSGEQVSGAHVR